MPARQQTLHDTITWSYDLLTDAEQRLLRRLTVFVGGWTLESAEAVCNQDGGLGIDMLDGLQALIDQRLIQQGMSVAGGPCFRKLETIREYALEQLRTSSEYETVRHQHAIYYGNGMRMFALNEEQTINDTTAQLQMDSDFDNLYAALLWAIEWNDIEIGLWMSGFALAHRPLTPLQDRLAWMETLLEIDDAAGTHASPMARAIARHNAGWSAALLGPYDRAQAHFQVHLDLCLELEDGSRIAQAYRVPGWGMRAHGNFTESHACLTQALVISSRSVIDQRVV